MYRELSTASARKIEAGFREAHEEIISLVRSLVEIESPSGHEPGSRAVVDLLACVAGQLSCVNVVERVDVPNYGQHLVVRAFQNNANAGTILIVGHTDTVHPIGSLSACPWRVEDDRIYGPGVFDMKANCALVFQTLQVCANLQIIPQYSLTVALTCDEEVGSGSGWPLLKRIAQTENVRYALVLEPPATGGRLKTARKGTAIFEMSVQGRAAHAGLDPEKGASAILELARQIERLQAMNNRGGGITVNVGVVHGGTRSNVIAAEAHAEIDVRFSTAEEGRNVEQMLFNLEPFDDRVRVTVTGGINRPPLERTEKVAQLYKLAQNVARSFEFELSEAQVGGASDGNFLASLGIPVLDGLGIDGDGAHAAHEHVIRDDIPRRGSLLAGLIASL